MSTYWFSSALGPLKSVILRDLDIDNAAYGVVSSSPFEEKGIMVEGGDGDGRILMQVI